MLDRNKLFLLNEKFICSIILKGSSLIYKKKRLENINYIEGLLNNDNAILKKIYDNYAARIAHHIRMHGGTNEDAKDVFHDALMVIYQKAQLPDFQLTSQFYTYLHSICHFIWDRKKKKKSNNAVTISEDFRLIDVTNIEEDILKREKYLILQENFQKLGSFCQQLLELFFAKESMEFIAQKLNLKNEHTARNRKYRCQKKLEEFVRSDARYKELT